MMIRLRLARWLRMRSCRRRVDMPLGSASHFIAEASIDARAAISCAGRYQPTAGDFSIRPALSDEGLRLGWGGGD